MKKPFFFRIESAALIDFATDPDGSKMSLLDFAKELQKGQSSIPFIQGICDEAKAYIKNKSSAGRKGMEKRWKNRQLPNNKVITSDNSVITKDNTPVTRNRKEESIKKKAHTFPDDFNPSESHIKKCEENKIDICAELEKFKNHHKAKGNKFVDWGAAFHTWLGNSIAWGQAERTKSAYTPGGANDPAFLRAF